MNSSSRNRSGRLLIIFSIILASMSLDLTAQIDRTRQPAPDPPPTAAFPSFERFTLDNGLTVFFVPDSTSPVVTLRMLVRGGTGQEGERVGLADAAADLLTRGAGDNDAQEFAERIDFIGGTITGNAGPDAVTVSATGLKRHFPTLLELFSAAVVRPRYDSAELQKYVHDQITSLRSAKARTDFLAQYAMRRLLFGQTPYGALPQEESFRALTPDLLRTYHDRWFRPSNATLAVVGPFAAAELRQTLSEAFRNWSRGTVPAVTPPSFPSMKGRRVLLVDRPTAVQSSIRIVGSGPLLNAPERPQTTVLNSILGGGTGLGNRLAMNLRETHAWTYSPYSYFDANLHRGYFVAGADVRNEVTDSAVAEMLSEIGRLSSEPVPADELRRNVQSAIGSYLLSIADPTTTAVRVQSIDFYGLPADYYDRLVSGYEATDTDLVRSLAARYLAPDDLDVVVVGNASEIASKLERFGAVELYNADLERIDGAADAQRERFDAVGVWKKMVNALGGERRLRGVRSLAATGKMTTVVQGVDVTGRHDLVRQAPDKFSWRLTVGPTTQATVITSDGAWRAERGALLPVLEHEAAAAATDRWLFPEARLEEIRAAVEPVDIVTEAGERRFVVALVFPGGIRHIWTIDSRTNLPVTVESPFFGLRRMENWTKVEGIQLPRRVEYSMEGGRLMVISDIAYRVNAPVEPGRFDVTP